jgi:formate C-acetyltransferase
LANLADALYVIREEVYEQARITLAEMKDVLETDFAGHEMVRQRFLNGYPKYGQGDAGVDALVAETLGFITATCAGFTVEPDESHYVPGAFAWVMHERLGRQTGATPDGRRAGFPFADGCGPAQGRERCGPTAAVLSVTGWDHSRMIGGLAYNLKFNSSLFRSDEGFEGLKALILTYLRRGGFEVQVNVVDGAVLKDARAHPEQYSDLIVRIGGYADYFTRLSPEMQDELILRTEFEQF